jgi:hypothetical protein
MATNIACRGDDGEEDELAKVAENDYEEWSKGSEA